MNLLIVLLSLAGLLIILIISYEGHRYNQFLQNAKPGDTCRFYVGEEKYRGVITKRSPNITQVHELYEDKIYTVPTLDTYPTW